MTPEIKQISILKAFLFGFAVTIICTGMLIIISALLTLAIEVL